MKAWVPFGHPYGQMAEGYKKRARLAPGSFVLQPIGIGLLLDLQFRTTVASAAFGRVVGVDRVLLAVADGAFQAVG